MPEPEPDGGIRPITDVLGDLRSGSLDELTARMPELVQSVLATGKKGTVTIKLDVKPSKTDDYAVELTESVKINEPQPDAAPTLMFAGSNGALTKVDPRSRQLPGMEVDG